MKARKLATDGAPLPTTDLGVEESPPDILEIIRTKLMMASERCDADAILDTVKGVPAEHALAIGQDDEVMRAIGDALTYDQALELVPHLGRMPPVLTDLSAVMPDEELDAGGADVETFQEELGEAEDYSAMARIVGALIDARTAGPGSFCKGKASLTFRFPPKAIGAGGPKAGFELKLIFEIGASRGEKKTKVKAGLGVQVVYAAKSGPFGLKAEIGALLMATATAQGSNGAHCLDLIGLGVLKQIEGFLGREGSDRLLGEKFQDRVVESMDAVDAKKPSALSKEHRIGDDRFERKYGKLDAEAYDEKKAERDQARADYAKGAKYYEKAMKNADYVEMGSSLTLHAKLGRERKKDKLDELGNVISTKKHEDELKGDVGYERSRKYYKSNKGELKKADVEQYAFATGTAKFGDSKAKVKVKVGLGKKSAGKTRVDVEGEQALKFEDDEYLKQSLLRTTVGLAADIKQIASKGKRKPDASFFENLDASFGAMTSAHFQPFVDQLLKQMEPSAAADQRRIAKGKDPKKFKFKGKSKIGLEFYLESYGPTFSHGLSLSAVNTRAASIDGGAVKGEIELGAGNKVQIYEHKSAPKDMKKQGEANDVDLDDLILEPDALFDERTQAAAGTA